MSYLAFILTHGRLLAFGFVFAFFAAFGHSYAISLFSADIRAEFSLSHGEFGTLYMFSTIGAGFSVLWLGRQIDRVDLRIFALLVCIGLIGACFFVASVPSVVFLTVALFTLRLAGQGMMGHVAMTSMARYFDQARGKAVGFAALGYPVAQAVIPIGIVLLNESIGWRATWNLFGVILALLLPPLALWLLRGHGERHRRHLDRVRAAAAARPDDARAWSRADVLRDFRFYLILPAALAPSLVVTGLFFHQVHLVEAKGWSLAWFTSGYIGYAISWIALSLISGALIDRFGAKRLLPAHLLPMMISLILLAAFDHPIIAHLFLLGFGIGMGANITLITAIWAEIYGTAHLGAIRALVWALVVLASAFAPAGLGWLFDAGVTIEAAALLCLAYALFASAIATVLPRSAPAV